ncbi:hypothetical protein O3P69_016853 [Scylla paramamosain]|uniref:Uncharacterized protein n=1 Tax=Scylla paramamosain TaxID=85552 RepID=A0AAW0SZU8_SCYPA
MAVTKRTTSHPPLHNTRAGCPSVTSAYIPQGTCECHWTHLDPCILRSLGWFCEICICLQLLEVSGREKKPQEYYRKSRVVRQVFLMVRQVQVWSGEWWRGVLSAPVVCGVHGKLKVSRIPAAVFLLGTVLKDLQPQGNISGVHSLQRFQVLLHWST